MGAEPRHLRRNGPILQDKDWLGDSDCVPSDESIERNAWFDFKRIRDGNFYLCLPSKNLPPATPPHPPTTTALSLSFQQSAYKDGGLAWGGLKSLFSPINPQGQTHFLPRKLTSAIHLSIHSAIHTTPPPSTTHTHTFSPSRPFNHSLHSPLTYDFSHFAVAAGLFKALDSLLCKPSPLHHCTPPSLPPICPSLTSWIFKVASRNRILP